MWNKRLVKLGVVAMVVVMVGALSLAALTGISEAGGGRGRGRGATGGGGAGGGFGAGTGTGIPAQDGTGTGGMNQGAGQGGYGAGNMNQSQGTGLGVIDLANLPPAVPGELPADVIAALNAGLQDEYHAYAVYQAVIDQFGAVRPFTSIQAAEASHIDALAFLFERYGLAVPDAAPLTDVPVFASVTDACATGAAAEIANFALYDSWIATTQAYPDIAQIFQALRDASEFNHLPAFERCAS